MAYVPFRFVYRNDTQVVPYKAYQTFVLYCRGELCSPAK